MSPMEKPPAATNPDRESLVGALWHTWRELPRRKRLAVAGMMTLVAASVGSQLAEGFAGLDAGEIAARLLSIFAGTGGALLLSLVYVLNSASQQIESCSPRSRWSSLRSGRFGFETRVLHRLQLALPTLGMIAGLLLSSVLGFLLVRSLSGHPLVLLATALYAAMVVLAALTVTRTTRFLYRHAREQAEAAAAARAEATEAQLAALQARMNPHFLFNALNTVASLVRTDPKTAETTVESLAEVLRRTLDRSHHTWRTVGDEVDYLEAYLAVEQQRWGDRLRVEWSIAPEVRPLPLPPMTLQPLVENALKHGLGPRLDRGTLKIAAARENGTLHLTVTDDGLGFAPRYQEGTGLGNLRRRLATLYGEAAELEIRSSAKGASVQIGVPSGGGAG